MIPCRPHYCCLQPRRLSQSVLQPGRPHRASPTMYVGTIRCPDATVEYGIRETHYLPSSPNTVVPETWLRGRLAVENRGDCGAFVPRSCDALGTGTPDPADRPTKDRLAGGAIHGGEVAETTHHGGGAVPQSQCRTNRIRVATCNAFVGGTW